jgi:stage II sporulation protein R
MKLQNKYLGLAYILILAIGTIVSLYIPKNEVTASESLVIPNEAIRLRILANSDAEEDQVLKRLVRDEVNANITNWVQELTNIENARDLLQSKLPEVQAIAEMVVKREGSTQSVQVEFGKVQFPTKLYGQFLYPAGEYEAILITLGEGKGANWWCVLFPPLCFLDFSNGVAVSDGFEERSVQATAPAVAEPAKVDVVSETNNTTEAKPPATKQETVVASKPVAEVSVPTTVETVVQEEETTTQPVTATTQPIAAMEPVQPVQTEPVTMREPVYVPEAEEKVEVKFFLKEMWLKLF